MSQRILAHIIAHGGGYEGFLADPGTMVWSGILRALEALLAGAPFLLVGVVVAGVLRGMVGTQRLRGILGGGPWLGPAQGWILGFLLPVCSLGVLPVARELRRARVPRGTIISFLIVAPVLNPISVLYGLSQAPPLLVMSLVAGTFLISVGVGDFWNRWCGRGDKLGDDEAASVPRDARARLAIGADASGEYLVGPVWIDYALVLLSAGLLGALLPHGAFQTSLTKNSLAAPLLTGAVAIPAYITPLQEMMLFNIVVREGYSLAAAFVLAVLGAGLSLGLLRWLWHEYGPRSVLAAVAMLLTATLCVGGALDRASIGHVVLEEDHTHAFDFLTRPSGRMQGFAGWQACWSMLKRSRAGYEWMSLLCLLGIAAMAGAVRAVNGPVDVAKLLVPAGETAAMPAAAWWNRRLPPRLAMSVLGIAALGGCVGGAYVVYPSPEELLDDMNSLHAEVVLAARQADWRTVERRIAAWQPLADKLQAGAWLRQGTITESQARSSGDLLFALNSLQECLSEQSYAEAEVLATHLDRVYRSCRGIFRSSPSARLSPLAAGPAAGS